MTAMLGMQVDLKNKEVDQVAEEKKAAALKIAEDRAVYEQDIATKKQDRALMAQANQNAVKKQIAERSTNLRSAGS